MAGKPAIHGSVMMRIRTGRFNGRHIIRDTVWLLLLTFAGAEARAQPVTHKPASDKKETGAVAPSSVQSETHERIEAVGERTSAGGLIRAEKAPKSVSVVTHDFIAKQAPASNPLMLLQLMPGANITAGDAFGVADRSMINVRGMNQQEIGYVVEGMPINDPDDYSPNSSMWIDSENIENLSLTQGSTDINSPVTNAAGGLVELRMRDPKMKRGGELNVSYGSYQTNRQFIRYDTGEIGHSGFRMFASYSNLSGKTWRGPGRNNRRHMDFKAIEAWGDSFISVAGTYHNANTAYYPSYDSVAQWNALKFSNNLMATYDVNDASYGGMNSYYKFYTNTSVNMRISAPMHFALMRHLSLDVTPYVYHDSGAYPFGAGSLQNGSGGYGGLINIANSNWNGQFSSGAPVNIGNGAVYQTPEGPAINAMYDWVGVVGTSGINSSLKYKISNHQITFGWWFGYTDTNAIQPFSALTADGQAASFQGRYNLKLTDGTLLSEQSYHTITQTNMLYISDTASFLNNHLHVSAGFKEAMISRNGTFDQPVPGYYNVNFNTSEPLPRFSIDYSTGHFMFFGNVNTNFRIPVGSAMYNYYNNPWSGDQNSAGNTKLKNEYSISEEVGARWHPSWGMMSVTLFNYNFTNHQINAYNGANPMPVMMNVGGMTSRGVDAEAGLKPWHHISPYTSAEYLYVTTDNNIPAGGGVYYQTRGKNAPSAPRWQAALGLQYDDGTVFGSISMKYVDKQYTTYMNDERIPGYKRVDMMLGLRARDIGFLKAPSVRMNIVNLTDRHYLAGVYSPGMTAGDGSAQLLAAPGFTCMATFGAGF
ncbi:TonB-dependent receptor [Acetobacter sp. AN02]|uniref:TonB-dependent receptor n=1 Tax=Acetobacter sp. AN02 TaxID=2894186 RepID=UPI0024341EC6|nr:TonB-dependent receptor [Acetobacter sp. AN02]MDG6094981.1 TonB-dependent receptor [Acetobacter sp. AN02]